MSLRSFKGKIAREVVRVQRYVAANGHEKRTYASPGPQWSAYSGLTRTSVAFRGMKTSNSADPVVNLLLPDLTATSVFAGARTALLTAERIANRLGLSLRILSFGAPPTESVRDAARRVLSQKSVDVTIGSAWDLDRLLTSERDVWIATYWTTAHPLDVAVQNGVVEARRVVYLIQDFEPSFYAASTESTLARSTYEAGFLHLINSRPLADVLQREGVPVDAQLVFRPDLDLSGAASAAAARADSWGTRLRIGFYGRPSKARNSFELGIAAMRSAIAAADVDLLSRIEFVSVGEQHAAVDLGRGMRLESRGKLEWADYFAFLATCPVFFSLQQTPHPSHPPLDAVTSGGVAVVNEVMNSRAQMSPRLIAKTGNPRELAKGLLSAIRMAERQTAVGLDLGFVDALGSPIDDALEELIPRLTVR